MKHMKLELLLCRFVDYSRQLLFTCTKPLFLFLGIVSPQRVSNTSNTIFQAYCHKLDLPPCRFVDYFQQLRLLSKYALISLFRDCFTTKAYLVEEGTISQAIATFQKPFENVSPIDISFSSYENIFLPCSEGAFLLLFREIPKLLLFC